MLTSSGIDPGRKGQRTIARRMLGIAVWAVVLWAARDVYRHTTTGTIPIVARSYSYIFVDYGVVRVCVFRWRHDAVWEFHAEIRPDAPWPLPSPEPAPVGTFQ
jgi:hypothetical protein